MASCWIIAQAINKLSSLFSLATSSFACTPSTPFSKYESVEELKRLYRKMQRINAVLRDADVRDVESHAQLLRLCELREVACNADNVIDLYQYEVLRFQIQSSQTDNSASELTAVQALDELSIKCVTAGKHTVGQQASGSFSSSLMIPVLDELSLEVKRINDMFDEITKDWRDLNLKKRKRLNRDKAKQRLTSSLVDELRILGRGKEKEEIIHIVLSANASNSEGSISVLPITGLGGIGKTTIAQLIYNDQRICQAFDVRGWVCVPLNAGVEKLTRSIVVAFSKKYTAVELDGLQKELMGEVKGKRFLLVLDDVWNEREVDWSKLQLPLIHALSGVLIVTTRNHEVTKMMQTMPPYALDLLPFESCWSLFKQLAFGNHDPNKYPNLLEVGRKIVQKCGDLPLAICALGNALRISHDDKPNEDEWLDVLNSELWEIKEGELQILPALKLSYDQMSPHLKHCFLMFSLFPKDHVFMKKEIVELWMSLGLVPLEGKKLAEHIGGSYFDELVQRSIIQTTHDGYVMHDCFHDLVRFVSSNIFSKNKPEMLWDLSSEAQTLSEMGVFWPKGVNHQLVCQPKILIVCRTFNSNISIGMHNVLTEYLKHLRALDFSRTDIPSLPDFVGILKQLRYLNIRNTRVTELPDFICHLYYLQTLVTGHPLQKLPAGISSLVNLRQMNFLDDYACMPSGIGRLKNLITLPMFHIRGGIQHCGIAELKDLVRLQGRLNITGLHFVTSIKSVKEADMKTKKYLDDITFDWFPRSCHIHPNYSTGTSNADLGQMVLDGLEPHKNIKELHINAYPGLEFPSWLGNISFAKMTKITLSNCGSCIKLPTLGSLPYLKFLSVTYMWNISSVGREFCSRDTETKGFRSLETLEIMYLPKWLDWWGVITDEFCSLHTFTINNCRLLKSLPRPFSSSLTKMIIKNCRKLETFPCVPMLTELILTGKLSEILFYNSQFPSLRRLEIGVSDSIISISLDKETFPSLEILSIHRCNKLQSVTGISDIASLTHLSIIHCSVLKISSDERIPPMLEILNIQRCTALQDWKNEQYSKYSNQVTSSVAVPYQSTYAI